MSNDTKPVIFLAFANDRSKEGSYLRNLPEEARQVHAALDAAAQAGLCEVVMRQNVTVDTVLDVFQDARYRNRIAVFHYGGHAESYGLLLETAEGKSAAADAGGLAAFLSRQTGLQLVFLNGCSTQPQVHGLLDAGVAAVIATAQAVDDLVATAFAVRFYRGLAGGGTVGNAFHEAEAACRTAYGNQPRSVFVKQVIESPTGVAMADRWPWSLMVRPGAESILQWNLPDAANNPLFGLPQLPPVDLPQEPFRNILWFRREDAPIFFGRGYAIRELFQRVIAPDAAPVVLYYGQSGVGKSSLLAAGLLPRLEQVQTVVYARRDQALGLAGTLAANLPGSFGASGNVSAADLLAAWRAAEAESGKPLTVLLDQAEEVYTRPNEALPGEMADFLDTLATLFGDPATRPQGKLILGFRKEWLAEIEKLAAERQIQHAKVFLQRLDRRSIVEAVSGPANSERLRQQYGLTVEDGLAEEIADDLLADPSSAVAPTLQILLSKLWKQARTRDFDLPHLDRDLYHDLRRQGLLLGDFLDQQMTAMRSTQSAAVDSGLALDLLAFHTTPLGTAEQRTLAELRATYAHQAMTLDGLLASCRDLYLLVDPAENQPNTAPASRLAHDTLAPLVRQRFEESDAPGQRARRILESRAVDWKDGNAGTPLDDADLALVEAGKDGMRVWKADEARLVEASLAAQLRRNEERERLQQERKNASMLRRRAVLLTVALGLTLLLAAAAGIMFNDSRLARDAEAMARQEAETNAQTALDAKELSEANEQRANLAMATAIAAQTEVEQQARRIRTNELTAIAANVYEKEPQLASLLMIEGLRLQNERGEALGTDALANIHSTLSNVGGLPILKQSSTVQSLSISVDGRWTAASAQDGSVYLVDNQNMDAPARRLAMLAGAGTQAAFSPDGKWLISVGGDELVRLWSTQALDSSPQLLKAIDSKITMGVFSPSGSWLTTYGTYGEEMVLWAWDMKALNVPPRILQSGPRFYAVMKFSPDERWLAAGSWDGNVVIWDMADREAPPIVLSMNIKNNPEDSIIDLAFSPDSSLIAASSGNKTAYVWRNWDSEYPDATVLRHADAVYAALFSPDGKWFVTGSDDDNARLWSVDALTSSPILLSGHNGNVRHLAFSPDSKLLLTGSDSYVRIWSMDFRFYGETAMTLLPSAIMRGHEQAITDLALSPDGTFVLTASQEGTVRRWDLANLSIEPRVLRGHISAQSVRSVAFVDSDYYLASAAEDGTIRLWDLNHAQEPNVVTMAFGTSVYGLAVAPDGKQIASASGDGSVRLWNIPETASIHQAPPPISGTLWSVAYSPDGLWLAAGAEIGEVKLWRRDQIENGSPITLLGHRRDVYSLSFSPDSRLLATGGWDGAILIYDLHNLDGHPLRLTHPEEGLATVAFSQDGRWLASGGETGIVRLWSVADISTEPFSYSGEPLELFGHDERVRVVAFSPDGKWLASAGQDNIMLLRSMSDLTTTPIVLGQRESNIYGVGFSHDGRYVATAHADGAVRIWLLSADDMIQAACAAAGRNLTDEEWAKYFPNEAYRQTCAFSPYSN